jgi:transposase and inactivated derivatives-like
VEAVHHQFYKLTKMKGGFANESSMLKLLYIGKVSQCWPMPIPNRGKHLAGWRCILKVDWMVY